MSNRTLPSTRPRLQEIVHSDFQVHPKFWSVLKSHLHSYLQDVIATALVILHIEVVDDELNATPGSRVNVPDTLLVGGIRVRVPGAAEGAGGPRQLRTTAC